MNIRSLLLSLLLIMPGLKAADISFASYLDALSAPPSIFDHIEVGNTQAVEKWIDEGHNLNEGEIVFPLGHAAVHGQTKMVELLLDHKADIDKADRFGATALHEAAGNGHLEACELLIVRKANLEATNLGETALITAARMEKNDIVKFLIDAGAKLNHTCGNTIASDYVTDPKLLSLLPVKSATCAQHSQSIIDHISKIGIDRGVSKPTGNILSQLTARQVAFKYSRKPNPISSTQKLSGEVVRISDLFTDTDKAITDD